MRNANASRGRYSDRVSLRQSLPIVLRASLCAATSYCTVAPLSRTLLPLSRRVLQRVSILPPTRLYICMRRELCAGYEQKEMWCLGLCSLWRARGGGMAGQESGEVEGISSPEEKQEHFMKENVATENTIHNIA